MLQQYYQAAKTDAVLAEKDWFGLLKLTGPDRISWLQGMVTNDVAKLTSGTGCYAAHLNAQGRMVGHMVVIAEENELWLCMERASMQKVHAAFDKLLIMEDVQISDASAECEILSVIGPKAKGTLERWLDDKLDLEGLYSHKVFGDYRVILSELGFDVWVPANRADKVLRALAQSGATSIDHGTWDVLRTEAGIPVYGVDIDETTTMPELGERGISYDKGCYIGQEVVAKIKYIGHVNRRFVGLVIEGNHLPDLKSPIRKSGKEVGYATTTLFSPGMSAPIGLAFVSRAAADTGSEVEILSAGRELKARIISLPFPVNSAGRPS